MCIRDSAKRPVRSLLDLACGTGTMTELFAGRGYTVTGVDYSPEMLAQAQQKPVSYTHLCKGDAHLLKSRFLFNLCSIAQLNSKGKQKRVP